MRIKHIPIAQFNPHLLIGLCIISLGIFLPFWIYLKNREFEELSEDAPHSGRAITILFIIPLIWFFLSYLLPQVIQIVGFSLILLLVEKYIFDFCAFYSFLTKTNPLIYFTLITIGVVGIYLSLFDKLFLSLGLILIFTFSIMQQELNHVYKNFSIKKEKKNFYNSYR